MVSVRRIGVACFAWCVLFGTALHAQRPALRDFDSFVLERSSCYGTCPAYRLELDHDGRVVFESLNPEDAGRTEEARIDSLNVWGLWIFALHMHFAELPDNIEGSFFCPGGGFDAPHLTVTVNTKHGEKHVRDFLVCANAPEALRILEDSLDRVANSKRWIRPRKER